MRGRLGRGVLAFGAAVAMVTVTAAASARVSEDEAPKRFAPIAGAHNYANFRPASLDGDRQVKVILELAGDSVAEAIAEAREQGRKLSKEEREALREVLKAAQNDVKAAVRARGGEVLHDYQSAFNGVAARVALKDVPQLSGIDGVVAVHPVRRFHRANTAGVQYLDAHEVWNGADGFTGAGVRVAVVDTGVDYTHASFGGVGTVEAFDDADETDTVIEGDSVDEFGAKVVGGHDFVGDDYTGENEPHQDPDPLDCNGHGTHVAGSAAGFGVLADGSTYGGPYNAGIYETTDFEIGPGVAPEADVLAYRVFGCTGFTTEDIIVAALDRALQDGADVVNMSLGSPFGRQDEPSVEASNDLAEAGVVVVASAGNSGVGAYITGAPAIANRAISVAAIDASREFLPGAALGLSTGETVVVQNSNDADLPAGPLPVKVLRNPDGTVALGCDPSEYQGVAGALVVTLRGVCARVARVIHGQRAGAAAVAMINTSAALPPFEGEIRSNPDTGEEVEVTIPFFGVRGVLGPSATDDGDKLVAADGGTTSLAPAQIQNPGYKDLASFTSAGPRNVDSAPKPDVTAPGVSVISAAVGSGFRGTAISGTSMAAPMTAGIAALVTEAHPDWSTARIKAAIMNTADVGPDQFQEGKYTVTRAGAGAARAPKAVDTVAFAFAGEGQSALAFGYEGLSAAYSETLAMTLENTSDSPITYDLAATLEQAYRVGGSTISPGFEVSFAPSTVTVPAGGSGTVNVTLSLPADRVSALPPAALSNFGRLYSVRGVVTATPASAGDGVYALRVPLVLVPRGLSRVTAGEKSDYVKQTGSTFTTTLPLTNSGPHAGNADVYAWGIEDADDVAHPEDSMDVRAVGVQVLPGELLGGPSSDRTLVFAINNHGFFSNPSVSEYDVAIDLQNDGRPEYFVVGVDVGAVLAGSFDGRFASFIFDAAGNLVNAWVAEAPMNTSTVLLPTLASDVGLAPRRGSTRFNYWVNAFSIVPEGYVDTTAVGEFRVDQPPVSTGEFVQLAPGETETITLTADKAKLAGMRVLGWLVATVDDPQGGEQAALVPLGDLPPERGRGRP